jgi:hypothetical protein
MYATVFKENPTILPTDRGFTFTTYSGLIAGTITVRIIIGVIGIIHRFRHTKLKKIPQKT